MTTFSTAINDDSYLIHAGEVVSATHVVVDRHPDLFEEVVVPVDHP